VGKHSNLSSSSIPKVAP